VSFHKTRSPQTARPAFSRGPLAPLLRFVTASLLLVQMGLINPVSVHAQTPAPSQAFDILIEAPQEIRAVLEQHLPLQRFRAVSDLDDNELARLIVLADTDVRSLLGALGYFSPVVRISRSPVADTVPSASPRPPDRPRIAVTVTPGPATRTVDVKLTFTGDIATAADADAAAQRMAIEQAWRLPPGQRFTQAGWEEAKTQALRELTAKRYPGGRISHSQADIDAPASAAHLSLQLDSGPLYRLGELQVSGLQRYDPVLVPRLARLKRGDVYDQRQLVEAQQRLASSGYFDSAYVLVNPESKPESAPVTVQLHEAPLQKIVLGVGLTTDSGPRASLEHSHNRVPGTDWRAVTKLQLERKSPFAQTEWTSLPDERNWRWMTTARVARLDDGELVTRAQTLRFGRVQSGERIDRNVYLQYERANVGRSGNAITLDDARIGDGSALSLNYGWTGRYFDSLPFPSRGYGLGFDAGGGSTLGTERQPYARAIGRWLGITPLGRGRLALRAEGGALLAADNATLPATQLFRTGGDTSVRGYGLREIGVALPNGSVGPGRYLAVASAEWQRPILLRGLSSDWESTVFVDAGNVADRAGALGRDVAFGVGAGARWKSPVGPLQMDLAYGVKVQQLRLHLSVGFVF
jgi:translocation and assembly module TamA